MLMLAEAYYHSGNIHESIGYLERLENISPGMGSYQLARIYAEQGNADEAVRHLESHLRSAYKLPSNIILLDDAFAGIEESLPWKKLWRNSWYTPEEELLQEIRYLNSSGNHLEALEKTDLLIHEKGERDDLLAERARTLLSMQQYQGAVQSLSRAIELRPMPEYYRDRAKAYEGQKKPDKAAADLEKALRLEPERLELLKELGILYRQEEDLDRSILSLKRYLSYYPVDNEAIFSLGQTYYSSGKYLDALGQFNACLENDTSDPRFFAARGKTYLETGTYRYAIKDLSMALDLDPNQSEVWYMKGLARWKTNDREGAISDWKQAARLGSRNAALKLEEQQTIR
jgi:tetratricopeptide (TPR) repeat protein